MNKPDFEALQDLLEKQDGSHEPFLLKRELDTWDEEHLHDMTSLAGQHADKDALSKFIDKMVRSVYHRFLGHRYHDPISVVEAWGSHGKYKHVYYSDARITAVIDTLSTILASVLPTISALAIWFLSNPLARMCAIIGCTLLFSTILTLIGKPKRVECFTASAAFAAVLVVFVGGNSNASVC